MSNVARVCRALKTLPLFFLSLLLAWVLYTAFLSIGVLYYAVELHSYGLFALHSLVFFSLWGLTVWSLIVTVNRGPGYVEKGTRKEEDFPLHAATPPRPSIRSRRISTSSEHDSGIGDLDRPEEQLALLRGTDDDLPLDRLTQKAAEAVGFDAKEAHPGKLQLAEDALLTAKSDGSVRYCRKCQSVKPDRAHHCSICGQCVLLMDHHCPWISTCVGHRNRKAFVLFLTYGTALAWYCAVIAISTLMSYTEAHSLNYDYAPLSWAFLLLLGFVFGLVLSGFTGYHWWLVANNRTTLENMESSNRVRFTADAERAAERYRSDYALSRQERRRLGKAAARLNIFDLGMKENVAMFFGPPRNGTSPYGRISWIIPAGPVPGDGRTWPINERHRAELERISREVRRIDDEEPPTASTLSSAPPTGSTTSTSESV